MFPRNFLKISPVKDSDLTIAFFSVKVILYFETDLVYLGLPELALIHDFIARLSFDNYYF